MTAVLDGSLTSLRLQSCLYQLYVKLNSALYQDSCLNKIQFQLILPLISQGICGQAVWGSLGAVSHLCMLRRLCSISVSPG